LTPTNEKSFRQEESQRRIFAPLLLLVLVACAQPAAAQVSKINAPGFSLGIDPLLSGSR
jgi:hypothetical protein